MPLTVFSNKSTPMSMESLLQQLSCHPKRVNKYLSKGFEEWLLRKQRTKDALACSNYLHSAILLQNSEKGNKIDTQK